MVDVQEPNVLLNNLLLSLMRMKGNVLCLIRFQTDSPNAPSAGITMDHAEEGICIGNIQRASPWMKLSQPSVLVPTSHAPLAKKRQCGRVDPTNTSQQPMKYGTCLECALRFARSVEKTQRCDLYYGLPLR